MLVYSGTLASASPAYSLIATLNGSTISIYESPLRRSHQLQYAHSVHQFSIDPTFAAKVKTLSFSPKSLFSKPKILLASTNTVHIYSALLESPSFHASIINAASPSVSLQNAIFLTADEVLLVPDIAPRITIRNVLTGLGVELRDVKYTNAIAAGTSKAGSKICPYSIRKKSGHVAFLTRPSVGKDVVVIFTPPRDQNEGLDAGVRTVETEFSLTASDALGLQFSPDGAWLAIWDAASAVGSHDSTDGSGSVVCIYTPTGKLYKQWRDSAWSSEAELSLGVERTEWIADGRLAIATVDGRVVILAAKTFEEEAVISHPTIFEHISDSTSIYVEQIATDSGIRSYAAATLPAAPPTQTPASTTGGEPSPRGIILIQTSIDGSLLASVSAHTPTTVHITNLRRSHITTRTVLIHHAAVKSIEWHPTKPAWLMIRTIQDRSNSTDTVYTWSDNLPEPMIIKASIHTSVMKAMSSSRTSASTSAASNNTSASWIVAPEDTHPDAIPDILFSFPNAAVCLPALPLEEVEIDETSLTMTFNDDTPIRQPSTSSHKLTQKTPIRGHGPEDAFDQSFEQLRAESLAQSISESVTDGGFSPVKFDATDWTRRQILGEPDDDQDDTFVGKGRRH